MNIEQFMFRILGMIVGLFVIYFSYNIWKSTKGATKGWFYMTLTGAMLSVWTFLIIIFTFLDFSLGRLITSFFFIPGSIMLASSIAQLAIDFGVKTPKILTAKHIWVLSIALVLVLFAAAFGIQKSNPLAVLVTVILIVAVVNNIIAMIGIAYIYRSTKRSIWIGLFVFALFLMFGQTSCVYSGNCCAYNAADNLISTCAGFQLDYIQLFHIPCNKYSVSLSMTSYNFLSLAAIIMLYDFYYLWKKLANK